MVLDHHSLSGRNGTFGTEEREASRVDVERNLGLYNH